LKIKDSKSKPSLATPALTRLLNSLGSPETGWEKETLTRFLKTFRQIKNPSPDLAANLNALCAKALDTADAIVQPLFALANECTSLDLAFMGIKTSNWTTAAEVEEYAAAYSRIFHGLDREFAPVYQCARKLLLLALEKLTRLIRASQKRGTRK
jgi:hypothetical protein